jgi:hypothetical protein
VSRRKSPPPLPPPAPGEHLFAPTAPVPNLTAYAAEVREIAERLVEANPHYQDPVWDRYRELREVCDRMRT